MKAFLLTAGLGMRLRPLTNDLPKCLLPICGKPLLEIWIDLLGCHGIDEVLVNTHWHAEKVEQYIKDRDQKSEARSQMPKVRVFYEEDLLGSAGTVYENRDFVQDEEEFWVIYGDNLSAVNLKKMHEAHKKQQPLATIGLFEAEKPEECGIATLDERGRILDFEEKPVNPRTNLANAGIYVLSNHIFDQIRWDFPMPMDFGFQILPQLIGRMYGHRIGGYHRDIGTPENYERAQREYLEMGADGFFDT